jgi:hypothetical protein
MRTRLRTIVGWLIELVGLAFVCYAAWTVAPALGIALAGIALAALGYTIYGDNGK